MIRVTNLSHMPVIGWKKKYLEILKEFNYSEKKDLESARRLNLLLKEFPIKKLQQIIEDKSVFVIGAGPSLSSSLITLKKFKDVPTIVADGAVTALIQQNIIPDVVVTDLDGDLKSLKKIGKKNVIFVVHAHGDNIERLDNISHFKKCIGSTQTKPFGKIFNFGGFTDGDRSVFLADYFNAKKIILLGMDFGTTIGKYSKISVPNKKLKIRKLRRGKKLLEWLAAKNSSKYYTNSKTIKGFKKISDKDIQKVLTE